MREKPALSDMPALVLALLIGLFGVAALGFLVLLVLPCECMDDGSIDGAPLRPLVLPLMGPLAFGVSTRAGQRSRQISSASPQGVCHSRCCSRPSRCTPEAALSLLSVFSAFSPAGGERKAPNTFHRRKTLS